MSTMTLEQVRYTLASWLGGSEACLDAPKVAELYAMVSAIDAHLAQNAQVKDWRIVMFNRWRDRARELGFAGIDEAVEAHAERARTPSESDRGVSLREAADEALGLLQQLDPQHGITTQLEAALARGATVVEVTGVVKYGPMLSRPKHRTEVGVGAKLYAHTERARVPPEVAAWVDAKREHKRLVVVYNDRLAYAKQHDLGRVSVDHEYQAMCAQQRVMDALIEPMFAAFAAAPSQPEDAE